METIGQRITRLRNAKGWSRPELGRQMATAVGRESPFTGELIRLYEEDINRPSKRARSALAKAFDRSEAYIEFGAAPQAPPESDARIKQSQTDTEKLLDLIRTFLDADDKGKRQLVRTADIIGRRHRGSAPQPQPKRAKRG